LACVAILACRSLCTSSLSRLRSEPQSRTRQSSACCSVVLSYARAVCWRSSSSHLDGEYEYAYFGGAYQRNTISYSVGFEA